MISKLKAASEKKKGRGRPSKSSDKQHSESRESRNSKSYESIGLDLKAIAKKRASVSVKVSKS